MNDFTQTTTALQPLPDERKKVWQKPQLDILELQTAQHGGTSIPDNLTRHRSGM